MNLWTYYHYILGIRHILQQDSMIEIGKEQGTISVQAHCHFFAGLSSWLGAARMLMVLPVPAKFPINTFNSWVKFMFNFMMKAEAFPAGYSRHQSWRLGSSERPTQVSVHPQKFWLCHTGSSLFFTFLFDSLLFLTTYSEDLRFQNQAKNNSLT